MEYFNSSTFCIKLKLGFVEQETKKGLCKKPLNLFDVCGFI